MVEEMGCATLWRWLSVDASSFATSKLNLPRYPDFPDKAGPLLDLSQRV
jgi:hypothetical protein